MDSTPEVSEKTDSYDELKAKYENAYKYGMKQGKMAL